MQTAEFRAMNTEILLAAEGKPEVVAHGFAQAEAFIHAAEARLTRFSDASELAALNCSSGNWFRASDDLFDLVREARDYFDQTNGWFDPTILDALEAAGYDKSMDEIRAHGVTVSSNRIMRARYDFRDVDFDEARCAIRLPRGMRIDLGGIAKGGVTESAALILADYADACVVDAGGDMFAIGLPKDADAWDVEIEDPRDAHATLAVLRMQPGAVATSSITKRRWQKDGQSQHHLIDPRTGEPAKTDLLSVTVTAPHATTAEVFAKALLIAGSREAPSIASRRDDISLIAVDGAGKLWSTKVEKSVGQVSKIAVGQI